MNNPAATTAPVDAGKTETTATGAQPPAVVPVADKGGAYRYFRFSQAEHEELVLKEYEDLRADILWLGGFCVARCNASYAQLHKVITDLGFRVSEQYVYQTLACKYFKPQKLGEQAKETFRAIVEALRKQDKLMAATGQPAFVKTSQWFLIHDFIQARRVHGTVRKWGGIVGATDLGKSRCYDFFSTEYNHGSCIHVECAAIRSVRELKMAIAARYNENRRLYGNAMDRAIHENVNHTRTIILDNFQNLYNRKSEHDQPALVWLRKLQDETKCTLIPSWTPWCDFNAMILDTKNEFMRQFLRRLGGAANLLILDQNVSSADVRAVAKSFLLDEVNVHLPRLVKVANQAWGNYTPLFEMLQDARRRATKQGCEKIETRHLVWPTGIAA